MKNFEKERVIRIATDIRDNLYDLIKLLEGEGGFYIDDIDSLYVADFRIANIISTIENKSSISD